MFRLISKRDKRENPVLLEKIVRDLTALGDVFVAVCILSAMVFVVGVGITHIKRNR